MTTLLSGFGFRAQPDDLVVRDSSGRRLGSLLRLAPAELAFADHTGTTSGAPVRFRTVRAVTIEPRVGAAVMAEIEAVDLGPSGNVSGGQINAIDGSLGLQLAVTNPSPTTGGGLSQAPAVTAADRERVRAELLTRLQAEAMSALEGQLAPGEFLAADSVTLKRPL